MAILIVKSISNNVILMKMAINEMSIIEIMKIM